MKIGDLEVFFHGSSRILLLTLWRHILYKPFSGHIESLFLVDILIIFVEDDTICQESSRLLPGARKVLLASLSDMQKTWKRMNIFRQARELISGIQPH